MNKRIACISAGAWAAILLAGCAAQPAEQTAPSAEVESTSKEPVAAPAPSQPKPAERAPAASADGKATTAQSAVTPTAPPAKPAAKPAAKRAADTAKRTASETMPFSLKLAKGYELTAEEPGKDLVFQTADDRHSMRLEVLSKADGSYKDTADSVKETIQASADDAKLQTVPAGELPAGPGISKPLGVFIKTPDGSVTGYLFEKDNLLVRATVFDTEVQGDATTAMRHMLETIQRTQN